MTPTRRSATAWRRRSAIITSLGSDKNAAYFEQQVSDSVAKLDGLCTLEERSEASARNAHATYEGKQKKYGGKTFAYIHGPLGGRHKIGSCPFWLSVSSFKSCTPTETKL